MKQLLIIFALFSSLAVTAQKVKPAIGGYGIASAEITQVNGKAALSIGAYGGVLINHKFLIGASGHNIVFRQNVNSKSERFQFNEYGLYSEYRIAPTKPVQVYVGLTGGMGWFTTSTNTTNNMKKDGDFTYVIRPQVGMNVKITSFMQARIHGGYRFTGNTNSAYYQKDNINGWNAGAGLAFGTF